MYSLPRRIGSLEPLVDLIVRGIIGVKWPTRTTHFEEITRYLPWWERTPTALRDPYRRRFPRLRARPSFLLREERERDRLLRNWPVDPREFIRECKDHRIPLAPSFLAEFGESAAEPAPKVPMTVNPVTARGRPKGRSLKEVDKPFFKEMHQFIKTKQAVSPTKAAQAVIANHQVPGASDDARVHRLVNGYKEWLREKMAKRVKSNEE